MKKKKILHVDSRDYHFHQFGSRVDVPAESNFRSGVENIIEQPSEVTCTAISTVKIAESKTKNKYDVQTLWSLTPHTAQGADPRDTLGTAVKQGLLNTTTASPEKVWAGYYRADTGSLGSAWDNIRSAMTINGSSCTLATNFYANWLNINKAEGIVPQGDTVISEHDYVFLDWVIRDGVTYALVDFHLGYNVLMPQEVLNTEVSKLGCGAYIGSDRVGMLTQTRNLLQWLIDLYNNLVKLNILRLQQTPPPASPVTPPPVDNTYQEVKQAIKPTKIENWANAIKLWEGSKDPTNPGNMKYTALTKSLGATQGRKAQDGGYFATFKDYDTGFKALCSFLTMACKGELIISRPRPCSFQQFTVRYAGNPPQNYINQIAKLIPCKLDDDIATFLTT